MKFKKLLSVAAAAAMAATALLGSLPMVASAIGGNAGTISWDLDTSTGVLTISRATGTVMPDYTTSNYNRTPWYNYRSQIKSVVITDEITYVGKYAFYSSNYKFTDVTLADSVTSVGDYAFYQNSSLKTVTMSDNLTAIGNYSFANCSGLETVQRTATTQVTQPKVDAQGNPVMEDVIGDDGQPVMVQKTDADGNPVYNKKTVNRTDDNGDPIQATDPDTGDLLYEDDGTTPIYETEEVDDLDNPVMVPQQVQATETVDVNIKGFSTKLETIGQSAFYGDAKLTGVPEIPATVTTIGTRAFESCSAAFETINFASNCALTSIDTNAFKGCTSLKSLSIMKSGITEIPARAFADCTNLESVRVHNKLTTIGESAFSNCRSLTDAFWTNVYASGMSKLATIGSYAFENCTGFTQLTKFPSTLKTIGQYAFKGCTNVTTVTFPSSTATDYKFSSYIFSGCTSLTSVTLPSTLTEIPASTFNNCTALTSYTVPSAITSIGNYAFSGCTALESMTFTSYNLTNVGSNAFYNCKALKSLSLPSSVKTLGANAFEASGLETMLIPTGVTAIPSNLFKNCTELTSVSFADNVTSFGDYVFSGCTALKTVSLPKNLETVTGRAFDGSSLTAINAHAESTTLSTGTNGVLYNADQTKLIAFPAGLTYPTSFSVPSTVETIGTYAFSNNKNIRTVTLNNTETIEPYAFYNCTSMTGATIPVKVKSIGNDAYEGCSAMTSLTFTNATAATNGSTCESIGNRAFYGTKISSVTTPNTLKSIGVFAFGNNTSLKTLTLNEGLETIGNSAFEGDTALTAVKLADTVTSLGQKAFKGCTALKSAKLSKGIKALNLETFSGCTSLQSASIPSGVETLANNVFYGCTSLEDVNIADSVVSIGTSVFQNCSSLKKAVIGSGVVMLPSNTFFGCTDENLNIYILGTLSASNALNYSAFGSNSSSWVKGNIYVYDDDTYTRVSTNGAVTSTGYATLKYGADFTELRKVLAEAKALDLISYTDASASVLDSSITIAESVVANYAASQGQADSAITSLKKAIDGLVIADNTEALEELADKIDEVSTLIKSDYEGSTYTKFADAVKAGKDVDGDALIGDIKKLITAIDEAVDGLVPSYSYPDVLGRVVYASQNRINPLNVKVTDAMDGATQLRLTFNCAPHVAFNQWSGIKVSFSSSDWGGKEIKGNSNTQGQKGIQVTTPFTTPLKSGNMFELYAFTDSWAETAKPGGDGYVFEITGVEFLNADGEVVFTTLETVVPNSDLLKAIEEAKAVDTTGADADKVAALNEAIEYAESVANEELPLPSVIDEATELVKEAVKALKGEDPKPTDPEPTNPDPSKPDTSEPSSNPSSVSTNTPTTATPVKTTRSPEVVKKDKAAAQKAMKQAKITKLSVKSKAKKKINVTWKKVKKATGYQVQVSAKKNFKKVIFKKNLKKTKLNIKNKKIKSKKTYYVRVRAYATYKDTNGKAVKVYSKWNKKLRKVKVK